MAFVAHSKGNVPHYRYGLPSHVAAGGMLRTETSGLTATASQSQKQQGFFWTTVVVCAGLQRGMAASRTGASNRRLKQQQRRSNISMCVSGSLPMPRWAIGAATTGPVVQTDHNAASTCEQLSSIWGLHSLTAEDLIQLERGLPVQKQQRNGGQGTGFVVFEVNAPSSVVLNSLSKFEDYTKMIPVVRQAKVETQETLMDGSIAARVSYKISKFWLGLTARQVLNPAAGTVRFELDQNCSRFLQEATGFWQVEQVDANRSRVWLRAIIRSSCIVPSWIIDYAAERALRRATSWLRPYTERVWKELQVQQLWKKHGHGEVHRRLDCTSLSGRQQLLLAAN
jgi:hypothetical protein